jgi:hypothetical protein
MKKKIEEIEKEIWKEAKPSGEFPQDWLVIPVLDVIELIKEINMKDTIINKRIWRRKNET